MPNQIKIYVETDEEKVKELINLIRKLKFEINELKKLGISERSLNKMFKLMIKK